MSALRGSFRGGRLRRVRSIATVTVLVLAGLLWIGSAQAVHDTGMFELDGNVVQNAATPPPYDWTSLFGASGNRLVTPDPVNGPVLASVFVNDTDAVDTTYFAGGTKIDDRIHNMGCGGPAANDKTSMDFVYAAVIHIPAGAPDNAGHDVLYLGVEKQAAGNGGDNAFGFWLFKDNTVGCSGSGSFTGAHTDGDLFIDGTFTNGGGTSNIKVFRWNGNDTTGSLGSIPVATGSVCGVSANDQQCAIANAGTITAGPWRSSPTMAADTFVEAGIDLTALLGANGGCFSTFLADSQSSQSTSSPAEGLRRRHAQHLRDAAHRHDGHARRLDEPDRRREPARRREHLRGRRPPHPDRHDLLLPLQPVRGDRRRLCLRRYAGRFRGDDQRGVCDLGECRRVADGVRSASTAGARNTRPTQTAASSTTREATPTRTRSASRSSRTRR